MLCFTVYTHLGSALELYLRGEDQLIVSAACGGDGSSTPEVINVTGVSPAGQYVKHGQLALVGNHVNPEGPIIQAEQTNI